MRLFAAAIVFAFVLSVAAPSYGGSTDRLYVWTSPCFEADSVRCDTAGTKVEVGLKEARFWAVRFRDNDTLYLGAKPLGPLGCRPESLLVTWLNGSMFEVLEKHVDLFGNVACGYDHVVDAVPADDTWDLSPGLLGSYFSDQNLTQLLATRVDSTVDFDWGTAPAIPGMPGDWFSVRWVGRLSTGAAGMYTFRILVNDACRLWVGDTAVIDDWGGDGIHSAIGVVSLPAGASPDLRVEMFEKTGSASATLFWTPPGLPETVVPASALSHRPSGP